MNSNRQEMFTKNIMNIRNNNKKFKEFFELEQKNVLTEEGMDQGNFEDSSYTSYMFQKYLFCRNFRTLVSLSLVFTGYFEYKIEFDQTYTYNDALPLMIWITIMTLVLFTLNVTESIIMKKRNEAKIFLKDVNQEQMLKYILRMVFSLIHPNILFFRKKWIYEYTYNGSPVVEKFQRNFNEYLFLFQFTWLYFHLIKTLSINTMWAADSSDRIVRMIGFRLSFLFILKCVMRNARKVAVIIILLCTLFYYTIALNVIESPLYYEPEISSGFKAFVYPSIALWNAVITLFTIGYGDLYVVTYLGRIFVAVLTILAGIILSFITVAMTIDFDFEDQDKQAFTLINSVQLKEDVEKNAAKLILAFFRLIKAKRKYSFAKILIYQIDFDMKKRLFSDILNSYKNNRSYDPYYPVFRAMVDLELKFEETQQMYVIKQKKTGIY
jgi:hypothetical protein